ncbi:MAG: hypothetical protein ACKVWR_16700, partial [Acidimicrobiales bacterium]
AAAALGAALLAAPTAPGWLEGLPFLRRHSARAEPLDAFEVVWTSVELDDGVFIASITHVTPAAPVGDQGEAVQLHVGQRSVYVRPSVTITTSAGVVPAGEWALQQDQLGPSFSMLAELTVAAGRITRIRVL